MNTYKKPMLRIVSINKNDVIVTSDPILGSKYSGGEILAPNRFDEWEEGF